MDLDGAGDRHDRATRGRRVPACRLVADRRRRRGARRAPHGVRGSRRRPALPRTGSNGSSHRSQAASPRRSGTCRTASCSPHAGCAGSPALAAEAGVEIREHTADRVARGARRCHRRRLHGRLPERTARSDRGADHPDARAGDRDRADPGATLRGATLRPPRVRLLASGRRTAAIVAGGFRDVSFDDGVHGGRESSPSPCRTALHAFVNGLRRPRASGRLRVGRHLRDGDGLPARRRTGAGARRTSGWPVATPATATCSASPAASSWPGPSLARTSRCSSRSTRRGCSTSAEASPSTPGLGRRCSARRRAGALRQAQAGSARSRRQIERAPPSRAATFGDREILDREPVESKRVMSSRAAAAPRRRR